MANCGVGHRHGSDLVWLWQWLWPEAVAPIRPLVWKPPNAAGAALKKQKKKKRKKKKEKKNTSRRELYLCALPG